MENIFIERLWRSLKYEAVYVHEFSDGFRSQWLISRWRGFYDTQRPHSALGRSTPAEAYEQGVPAESHGSPVSPPAQPEEQGRDGVAPGL